MREVVEKEIIKLPHDKFKDLNSRELRNLIANEPVETYEESKRYREMIDSANQAQEDTDAKYRINK
jgi:hypothetical protein